MGNKALLDASLDWTPPEAPLEMPQQVLERKKTGTEWSRVLRLILPGKPV
ncbi:hypothetical protein [Celeribacter sp. ULVN23_4]